MNGGVRMMLHREFVKVAKKFGPKLAIIDRSTGKRVTYSKALIASLILAKKIKGYKDGFIGVMIPSSAGSYLTVLGVLLAGKVPVMINYSTGAANNSEYAQKKCGFKTIITSRALLEKIGCRLVPGMVFIEDIMERVSVNDKLTAAMRSKLPTPVLLKVIHQGEPDDNAVILFTSGSEKDPKAVQLTHRNLYNNIMASLERLNVNENDIMMGILPLFHVFGHNTNFWLPLFVGMTIVTYANPIDYKQIPIIVREEKASILIATPVFFMGYLRKSKDGDFRTIRIAVAGADKLPETLRMGFKEKHGVDILEGYGATETAPVVSVNVPNESKPGSIGRPLPNVQVMIADIQTGDELPRGQEGKILVKGDNVMKGYFDDIEETSLRIKDGWYDTGDMGMLDEEGYLWHRGRLKRFVKIGGEMVSLVKVESELVSLLGEDVDCCVVEVPDSTKGAKIVAAVTQDIDEKKILKKLKAVLPNIAMPKQFVKLDELPKMGSGKVDFRTAQEIVRKEVVKLNNAD
jgi:acyl-[acyl-carrier-protein]-phospholipid O-acyltransferase/long-chain-fatty-acid--[acyl-carrier-protein] ligase